MQRFVLFMIVVVTTFDYLSSGDKWGRMRIFPGVAKYIPELLCALVLLYVLFAGTRNRFQFVRPHYWAVFSALLIIVICGIIINRVEAGPIFAGVRTYLRALPWFFLPAVFAFSERQIRAQLGLVLLICAVQIPLAIEQRMKTADASWGFVAVTGDWTFGTLMDSGVLSIFLVAAVCVAVAFYERRQLTLWQFGTLFCLLLLPTMINETKAMVVFLPLGLLFSYMSAAEPAMRVKRFAMGVGLLVVFAAMFIPIYDQLNADREYGTSIGDFFSNEENLDRYMSSNKELGSVDGLAGRGDAIRVPLQYLAKDPVHLAFGLGIGNVSNSAFGPGFSGEYSTLWVNFLVTAFSRIVLELGLLGFGLVLIVYWLIFQDCRAVARDRDSFFGALAAGWVGVVALIGVATFYTKVEVFPSLSFLFWYFSGLIAADRMRASRVRSVPESFAERVVSAPVRTSVFDGRYPNSLR